MKRILQFSAIIVISGLILTGLFQNCSNVHFSSANMSSVDAQSIKSGSLTVAASHPNPPLDLFFIVDNSGSMLDHQINLGQAFQNIFTSNIGNLSNFSGNIYLYSTDSTVDMSNLNWFPATSTVNQLPAITDTVGQDFAMIPGDVFSIWNDTTGATQQFLPAPVLGMGPLGAPTPVLHFDAKGSTSDADYQSEIADLTTQFQNRIAYLNPTNIEAYQNQTDISSGLCTMARILRHASDQSLVKPGDASAFVIVSDDNDRLNVRNPNNTECLESITQGANIVGGYCGNYKSSFTYSYSVPNAAVSYTQAATPPTQSTFSFSLPATEISASYPVESCTIAYTKTTTAYDYALSYFSTHTTFNVSYTPCSLYDGICNPNQASTQQSIKVPGAPATGSNGCPANVATYLSSQPDTQLPITCTSSVSSVPVTASGQDFSSNGSQCSSTVLNTVPADGSASSVLCTITPSSSSSTATIALSKKSIGTCSSYCANNSQLANCQIDGSITTSSISVSPVTLYGSLSCNTTCSSSLGYCSGTQTISQYLQGKYGASTACTASSATKPGTLKVASGSADCSSTLTATPTISGLGAAAIPSSCSSGNSVTQCISTMGGSCAAPVYSGATSATVKNLNFTATCSSLCSAVSGGCNGSLSSQTIAAYYQALGGTCTDSTLAKIGTLNMLTANSQETCSSTCSDALGGAGCDGHGYGVSNGATVAGYISSTLGGSCTNVTTSANKLSMAVSVPQSDDPSSQAMAIPSVCSAAADPIFFPQGTAQPDAPVLTYAAGDANHNAADFDQYIKDQATQIFGANNMPAVAVITHLSTDTNLTGTDVGQDYIDLAQNYMNSNQISSVEGDYSSALANISNFIVQSTQNSFKLSIPAGSTIVSVSVLPQGQSSWTSLDSSQWTFSGQTLSISSTVNLQIGDQLSYQYR